jgi:predicted  nucleic acid-binding Zn-ribbon protein
VVDLSSELVEKDL